MTHLRSERRLDISLSIVNYFTSDLVLRLIQSVAEGTRSVSYEILIVNNSSADSMQEIQEAFPAAKIIHNSSNVYFTKAENQNIRRASGRYAASISPDIVIPPAGLDDLVSLWTTIST